MDKNISNHNDADDLKIQEDGINKTERLSDIPDDIDLNKYHGKELNTGTTAYYVDSDIVEIRCTVASLAGSKLDVIKAPPSGNINRGSAVFVDFERGYFGFYQGITSSDSTLTPAHEKKTGFDLAADHAYRLTIIKQPAAHTLILTDMYSHERDVYTVYPSSSGEIGEGWGIRSYKATGDVIVSSFNNICTEPYDCQLLAIGDSFIEGASIYKDKDKRYAALMKKQLSGSCFIDGVGGATTEQTRARYNSYVKEICRPKYVLIGCGANDTDYGKWLTVIQGFISDIEAENSIPVLTTITRRRDIDNSAFITSANTWIRGSGYSYIDVNMITTLNNDGVTQNPDMFLSDQVHPTIHAHELIFQLSLTDVPKIFDTKV